MKAGAGPGQRPGLPWTAWLLLAARLARSVWQGALVVDFALYLRALGWSAVAISGLLAASLLVAAALAALLGPISDRFGRRRFLLAYDAAQILAGLLAWASPAAAPLAAAALLGGFGRGGNGAAGPFSPVEQAWLAHCVPEARRGGFFSLNAATGFLGMAAGSLLAAWPGWSGGTTPPAGAYRPLFLLVAALSAVAFVLIWCGREEVRGDAAEPEAPPAQHRRENALMRRLMLANGLNGLGIGLTGPLISYWFALRFHRGPESIGGMMALALGLSAVASLGTGRLTGRLGLVRAVVATRLLALALLVALPFAPGFWLAAALWIARSTLNRGTTGARSAVSVGIVRAGRRGLAASAANVSQQVTRAVGPMLAGLCFANGLLAAPFLAAALFQGAYLWVFDRSFRDVRLR